LLKTAKKSDFQRLTDRVEYLTIRDQFIGPATRGTDPSAGEAAIPVKGPMSRRILDPPPIFRFYTKGFP
jgi:hypothetical protein